jgi:hypothetical protein
MVAGSINARLGLLNKTAGGPSAARSWTDPEIERERAFLINFLQEISQRPAAAGIAGLVDAIAEEFSAFFRRGKTAPRVSPR